MGEPLCLRPGEIDGMTLAQLWLYYEDEDDDRLTHEEVERRVAEARARKAGKRRK